MSQNLNLRELSAAQAAVGREPACGQGADTAAASAFVGCSPGDVRRFLLVVLPSNYVPAGAVEQ